jgi:hypothetical protein
MKTFKAICAGTILALFLSIPAHADNTTPGDSHNPGTASPVIGVLKNEGDSGSTKLTTRVYSDLNFSAVANMLWTLASIF